ncbi:MAG TPA: hypothetical protein DEP24_09390 [Mycobacterium sp.]|nr:hypothetical protein [Mycobacterium sp.]
MGEPETVPDTAGEMSVLFDSESVEEIVGTATPPVVMGFENAHVPETVGEPATVPEIVGDEMVGDEMVGEVSVLLVSVDVDEIVGTATPPMVIGFENAHVPDAVGEPAIVPETVGEMSVLFESVSAEEIVGTVTPPMVRAVEKSAVVALTSKLAVLISTSVDVWVKR